MTASAPLSGGCCPGSIEEAVHYAKSTAGWSTYLNGMQTDFDLFQKEITQVCAHLRKNP